MKLIVGLGNPGKEYVNTRHNMGYFFIDNYAEKHDILQWSKKFNGLYSEFTFNNEKIILLKPLSYMNLSGTVVKKYIDFFKIDIKNVLVISDDLDLNVGTYRLRSSGSCGGHNGLRNIEDNLGTSNYKRLKIGISNNKEIDTKDYVLGKLSSDDMKVLNEMIDTVNNILDDYLLKTFDELMNIYNHK